MKIAAFYGAEGIKMEVHPVPKVPAGKALVKVRACGVCGGDYHTYGNRAGGPAFDKGIILGHEIVGEVVIPAGRLRKGELAAVSPNSGCGACWYCQHQLSYECREKPLRTALTGGGFGEYTVVEPIQCYPLPQDSPVTELAMAEPLACCIHSMNRVQVHLGDQVAILGAGCGAQLFIQLARLRGAARIVVFDNIEERLRLAQAMGADEVWNTDHVSPVEKAELSAGYDVVIVTRSASSFFQQALTLCAWRGRVLCYGVAGEKQSFSAMPNLIWKKQLSFIGSRSFEEPCFETAVALLISGRIKVESLIDRIVTLEELEEALSHPGGQQKTVLVPEEEKGGTSK